MIILSVTFILLCEVLKTTNGKECTIIKQNSGEIVNSVFENIKGLADKLTLDEFFNITELDSVYSAYKATEYNEDEDLHIMQLLKKYGYRAEQHDVMTSDGYVLTMYRIPSDGPVVFLMHGLFCSSDDFVTTGPGIGLAYLLADAGYDVWLGNARGNVHSRRHISLSPSCAEFWDFSWDEIGRYDLPAMIDYTLEKTNQKQLVYIGHSQGTTSFFVMCSERPEYNDKIKLMVALSAVSYLSHTKSPIVKLISSVSPVIWKAAQVLGVYEFTPRNAILEFLTSAFCGTPATATLVCDNLVFLMAGPDFAQINATALPVIFGHVPAGIATKQLIHYAQLIDSGKFRRFDYGLKNTLIYGSITPPDYPVEKITSPVVEFYSANDWFGHIDDVKQLVQRLPNLLKFNTVPYESFSHMDYLYAKDVKELLYTNVMNLIEKQLKVATPTAKAHDRSRTSSVKQQADRKSLLHNIKIGLL
ncbi:lipase 3-like [Galleria mellonella]|uniref:Lipase 3-like n=1 Tax=Galleria mellonella TaxID=7137 RepID=A0A6J1X5B1_GALME|nr:lipase 3-like [Galleria mellonella]